MRDTLTKWWDGSSSMLTFDRSMVAAALPLVRATAAEKCRCHLLFRAFRGPHSEWIPFSLFEYVLSRRKKKAPSRTFTAQFFDRKHLTACGFTAAPQIKYPSALGLAGCYVSLNLQSLLFFFFLISPWTWYCLKSMLRCLTNRFKQVLWIAIIWAADGSKMRIC